jgi:hypothetical protein
LQVVDEQAHAFRFLGDQPVRLASAPGGLLPVPERQSGEALWEKIPPGRGT